MTSSRLQLMSLHKGSHSVRSEGFSAEPQGLPLHFMSNTQRCREALWFDKWLKIIFQEAVTWKFPLRSPSHYFIGSESAHYRKSSGSAFDASFIQLHTHLYIPCHAMPRHTIPHMPCIFLLSQESMGEAVCTKTKLNPC